MELAIDTYHYSAIRIHRVMDDGRTGARLCRCSDGKEKEVIAYIKDRVKHDYCDGQLDMCQPTTLRMMEQQNLADFKQATQAKNRDIMDRVILDYCDGGIDMCNYNTLWMMYQENLKASSEELSW